MIEGYNIYYEVLVDLVVFLMLIRLVLRVERIKKKHDMSDHERFNRILKVKLDEYKKQAEKEDAQLRSKLQLQESEEGEFQQRGTNNT